MGLKVVFLVAALVCFVIKALGVDTGRFDMVAAGFAFVVASMLV